jgi:hypothetical protein
MFTRARIWTSLIFSLCFLAALHGFSIIKLLIVISINYKVTKYFGVTIFAPLFVWTYGISLLFLNDAFAGYRFESISPFLAWMDTYKGIIKLD